MATIDLKAYREYQLKILRLQADMAPFLPNVRDIAKAIGKSVGNTHRVLGIMVREGLVLERNRQYFCYGGFSGVKVLGGLVEVVLTYEMTQTDLMTIKELADNQKSVLVEGFQGHFKITDLSTWQPNEMDMVRWQVCITLKRLNSENGGDLFLFETGGFRK